MSEVTATPPAAPPKRSPGRPKGYSPPRPRTGTASGPKAPPDPQQAMAEARAEMAGLVREGHLRVEPPQAEVVSSDWEDQRQAAHDIQKREARRLNLLRAKELHEQAEHASRKRKGLPPVSAMPRRRMIDATVQMDADGKPAGTPGYLQKWVPLVDMNGREVSPEKSYAIQQHLNDGFRFVTARKSAGEQFTGPLGVFMEIDPLSAVHREFAYGGATIAVNPEDYAASEAMADINGANPRGQSLIRAGLKSDHGRHQSGTLDD